MPGTVGYILQYEALVHSRMQLVITYTPEVPIPTPCPMNIPSRNCKKQERDLKLELVYGVLPGLFPELKFTTPIFL